MSKRKIDDIERKAADQSDRNSSKRAKLEQRPALDANGAAKISGSLQLVNNPPPIGEGTRRLHSAANAPKPRRRSEPGDREARKIANLGRPSESRLNKVKTVQEKEQKRKKRRERKQEKKERRHREKPGWKVSDPIGGRMLNLDPSFSPDEQYLLLAYDVAIKVYSTSTSLLVRTLRTHNAEIVTGFAFSSIEPNQLYISTLSGITEKWDWISGIRLEFWNTKVPIHAVGTVSPNSTENDNGLVYTIDRHTRDRWLLTAHRLMGGQEAAKTELVVLLVYQRRLTSLKIVENGNIIIATAGSSLIIGTTKDANRPLLKDVTYVWREFECSEWITSIDIRLERQDATPKPPKESTKSVDSVDIVVGGLRGVIFIYEDILRKLIRKEKSSKTTKSEEISPRRLHWHRNAVSAVKWSADGNYVISGGEETVLVLWQLDTGQKHPLPHLSAAIESIVVSPNGSSYAIRLADNSAMILSTSELQPTFSISGIQTPITRSTSDAPFIPTVDRPYLDAHSTQYSAPPSIVTPTGASRLLLAVPASTATSVAASKNACYLQTLDMASGQQTTRQALTRTNVTALNIGPESNRIREPSVTHMQISYEGQWLATVDQWSPPQRDVAPLAYDDERVEIEQHLRLEVYLKLWMWNSSSASWELVSRIDNPHVTVSGDPCEIVDLASNPSDVGFATLGEDAVVRVWKPTARKRYGTNVQAKDGLNLTTWSCRKVIELASETGRIGKLGYSADSSVLLAALESSSHSVVHLIDSESGEVRSSLTNLFIGSLYGLGILGRYLILLGNDLTVWDMVTGELHLGVSFDVELDDESRRGTTHLAINHGHNTFAVAVPAVRSKVKARIAIFNNERTSPMFTTELPKAITSLFPATRSMGYHCLDVAAEIRTFLPMQNLPESNFVLSTELESAGNGLANIYGNSKAVNGSEDRAVLKLSSIQIQLKDAVEDDSRVINQNRLAEVFEDGSLMALPPVADLFEKVAALLVGR